ncbi:MAG: hypothetical protein ACJZ69_03590 [Pelagibacteraceae bacterium]|tara:strand:- start:246 stop:677 length:432 start_codon:yes stop_codon:yes gene_type:complete
MRKILFLFLILYPFNLYSVEKTKEEKVAKFIIENIQKDYINCYSFYKVTAESFKKAKKEDYIIKGLEKSADITLKYNYDLGEVLGLPSKVMAQNTKKKVEVFTKNAKKDFSSLTKRYSSLCKNLVENQKQRIDFWEKKGNKKF